MGNLGGAEILVIMVVALIVLGPNKLPEAARQIGRAITELKNLSSGFQQEMRDAMVDPEIKAAAQEFRSDIKATPPPKSPPALLADPTPPPDAAGPTASGSNAPAVAGPDSTSEAAAEPPRPFESGSSADPVATDETPT